MCGVHVLVDPVWSMRASPFSFAGPKRHNDPGIAFEKLPKIDVVLVSHGHYDHLDVATLRRLHERDAPLMAMPLGNDTIIRRYEPAAQVIALDLSGVRVSAGAACSSGKVARSVTALRRPTSPPKLTSDQLRRDIGGPPQPSTP